MTNAVRAGLLQDGARHVALALLCCALASVPARAQVADVHRLVTRDAGTGVEDTAGTFTVDAQGGLVRFDARDGTGFSVPFDRLTALHYERSKYPARTFRRTGDYLVLHYRLEPGTDAVEVVRLPGEAVDGLLASLETATGLRVDRSGAAGSFLGLPIHVAPGASARVTDASGRRVDGQLVSVSPTSIDLGAAGRFDVASVARVDVRDSVANGVATGVLVAVVPAALLSMSSCYSRCTRALGLSPAGWGTLIAGAFTGGVLDAGVLRGAYRPSATGGGGPRVRLGVAATGRSVRVTLKF